MKWTVGKSVKRPDRILLYNNRVLCDDEGVVMEVTEWLTMEEAMNALETILKSRRDSVEKIEKQIEGLDAAIRDCSLSVKPVYEAEKAVKVARKARLVKEVAALEAEVARLNPELPGIPPKHTPKK